MRRITAALAGITLVAGLATAPAQAAEPIPTTEYRISAQATAATRPHQADSLEQRPVINADDAAQPVQAQVTWYSGLISPTTLLIFGLGILIVSGVSLLSIRTASREAKEVNERR